LSPSDAWAVEHRTTLWRTYEPVAKTNSVLAMRKVNHRRDIYLAERSRSCEVAPSLDTLSPSDAWAA
jgi:hypothetical protein